MNISIPMVEILIVITAYSLGVWTGSHFYTPETRMDLPRRIHFSTYKYAGLLMRDNAFIRYSDSSQAMLTKGIIGKAGGMEIVLVPDTRLPSGASFLLVHKDACIAPRQLEVVAFYDDRNN